MSTKKASTQAGKKNAGAFSDDEKAAMKARAKELRTQARRGADKAEGEKEVLAAIAAMPEPDRGMCKRFHEIVTTTAPNLMPKTWYGMPAYVNAEGKVVTFFQGGQKFKTRYCTLGFSDSANLDDSAMWPTAFALTAMTPEAEKKIITLVKKAIS